MKIAVLSDTHGLLRPQVAQIIKNSDAVIHGGDIDSKKTLGEIKGLIHQDTPLFIVRGNNDGRWATGLPACLRFKLGGITFFLVHDKDEVPKDIDSDIIIFGHSHRYYEENIDGHLWLNPGSCGRRRFYLPLTMALLHIDNAGYIVEKVEVI